MATAAVTSSAVPADGVLSHMHREGFEKLVFCTDARVGLRAIICVHSTVLGPANGGVRMYPYASEADAVADVLRLARAMTYKWAAAGENRGGGKAVIVGDPASDKSEALLRRFGQFVDALGGEYYAGEDVGITLGDMEVIHLETDYVATLPEEAGGVGDIAPATARGAIQAMRACALHVWGEPQLGGRTVAVQGLGACGSVATRMLIEQGARVVATDVDAAKVERAVAQGGVTAVAPEEIYDVEADVFAPFAMGGVINDDTLPRLRVRAVAGSANNIFADERHGDELERRGIVYAPDFIANAGGAIYDAEQFRKGGFQRERAARSVDRIYDRVLEVFARAELDGIPCYAAAYAMAEERLTTLAALRR
jgi:leucine dehydrogenase